MSAASGTADVRAGEPSFGLRVVVPVLAGLVSLAMVASAGYLCVRRREYSEWHRHHQQQQHVYYHT